MWVKLFHTLLCTFSLLITCNFLPAQLPVADFSINNLFLDNNTQLGFYKINLQDQSSAATSLNWQMCEQGMTNCYDFNSGSTPTMNYRAGIGPQLIRLIATNSMGADTLDSLVNFTCLDLSPPPSMQCNLQLNGNILTIAHFALNDNAWDPNTVVSGPGISTNPCTGSNTCGILITQPGTYIACGDWTEGSCSNALPNICCDTLEVFCLPTSATWSHTNLGAQMVQFSDTGYANSNPQYLWDFGDGNTSTQQNPLHTYAQDGVYNVCLTVTDSCGSDQVCSNVPVVTTRITTPGSTLSGLKVSPNPSDGLFSAVFPSPILGSTTISILDLQGKTLWTLDTWIQNGQQVIYVDASLPKGLYLLQVSTAEEIRRLPVQIFK